MKVVFLKKFSRDLDKIKKPRDIKSIVEIIERVKISESLDDIPGIKKLTGRIRSGNYRIGVFVEDGVVFFARVVHRKDIYKIFP